MNPNELHGLRERLRVDTSESAPVYLLVSTNGSYIRLTESAYLLLHQVSCGVTFGQLSATISASGAKSVSADEIEVAYRRLVEQIAKIDEQPRRAQGGFWFRLPLIPAPIVNHIASLGAHAFRPAAAGLLLVMTAIAFAAVSFGRGAVESATGSFWSSYGLFLLSILVHEFGHASACRRYGAAPSEIGVTAYLIYPSFYSDVSAAWRLERWQRVVVDLGGIYFQLLFAAGSAWLYLVTGWPSFLGVLAFVAGSCLLSLNPFLKFDGYWVIADALGVTNLGNQTLRVVRHFYHRWRGRPVEPLPWSPRIRALLVIYTTLSLGFWVYFFVLLLPLLARQAATFAQVTPVFAKQLLESSQWPSASSTQQFATSAFLLLFPLALVGRLLRSLQRSLVARLRGRRADVGKPVQ